MEKMSNEPQIYRETLMELQPGKNKNPKITLEQYLDFTDSHKQLDLNCNLLRQIIQMHGFKRTVAPKKDLIEAVRSIELMEPAVSTIKDDDVSSCAFITMQEVIKDLSFLNWQECCITSVQNLNSVKYDLIAASTSKTAKSKSKAISISNPKAKSIKSKSKTNLSLAGTVITKSASKSVLGEIDGNIITGNGNLAVAVADSGCGVDGGGWDAVSISNPKTKSIKSKSKTNASSAGTLITKSASKSVLGEIDGKSCG